MTGRCDVRLIMVSGRPIKDAVYYSSLVMNTRERLEAAFD